MRFLKILAIAVLCLNIESCGIFKKKKTTPNISKKHKKTNHEVLAKYSEKLGTRVNNIELYSYIDDWVGTPYKFGGKGKSGIDCSNYTCQTLRDVFSFPSTFYFPSSKLAEQGKSTTLEAAEEGDLLFFSINQNSKISHVGIYLANSYFVHASTSKGVIISSLNEEYYKKRFAYIRKMDRK